MFECGSCQCTAEVFIKKASPGQPSTSSLAVLEQKRMFLKKLKTASSITDMAAHLKEMIGWCRRSKLYHERCYLAFTLIRCQRIKALESEGIRYLCRTPFIMCIFIAFMSFIIVFFCFVFISSVQKKLRRLRVKVSHVMLKGTSLARHSLFLQQRTKCYFRTRFTTLFGLYGSVRSRMSKVRKCSQIAKDLFNVKSSHNKKQKVPPLHKDMMSGSDVVFNQKEIQMETETSSLKSSSRHNNEIDDIFASFGL